MVLTQVGIMLVVGGTIGMLAAVGVSRLAKSLLYELEGHDTSVLIGAALLLTLIALGAGVIPANRAARIDPMRSLRYE
jgi:ABC-type antimicrobial peptide transport system permease subunit